ncbi:MAG: hypothetical protein ACRCZE_05435 [Candidatus Altimarinota bacterium]
MPILLDSNSAPATPIIPQAPAGFSSQTNPRLNNDILTPVRQTALIFFFLIGLTHIISGLMASNELGLPLSNLINKVLDIPFAIIATIFGLSNFPISSQNPRKGLYLAVMGVICLLVLGVLVYINLLIPDRSII